MAGNKPRIFFDTQFPIDAARGALPEDEWKCAWQFIRSHFRYAVSPLTLLELVNGMSNASEELFRTFRAELNILVPSHRNMNFLKSAGSFVLETVLDINRAHLNYQPRDLELWIRIIFRANSYRDLRRGTVALPNVRNKTFGFDPQVVLNQTLGAKEEHVRQLEEVRNGSLQVPNKLTWARTMLTRLGHIPTHEECIEFGDRLDAAYCFFEWLCRQACASNYNFAKHDSDWIDEQQLCYLADPQMYFLTSDAGFAERIRGSLQTPRLITYKASRGKSLTDVLKAALGLDSVGVSTGK